jgi:signal transduction histidine kinase
VKPSQRTRTIAVQTTPSLAELSSTELAELVVLERLTFGTVHALHNAFTTVLGEASFLESKGKGDSELEEACQVIRAEIDRCARLTRALHMHRSAPASASAEAPDLARIVRDLSGLLAATLSSRLVLRVETPEELLLVRGRASAIELLVILMVHHAAAFAPASAELRLCAIEDSTRGRCGVSVALHSPDFALEPIAGSRPPLDGRATALPALALHHLANAQGAEIEAERTAHALTLRLFLPASQGKGGSTD